jgi:hypothetical protein
MIHSKVKRTTIRRASPARARQLRKYAREVKIFLFEHPTCEVCKKAPSGQNHHRAGRIGAKLLDKADWLAICQPCHDRIHAHAAWAREQGFLK